MLGGMGGVMNLMNKLQIWDEGVCISLSTNALVKSMDPSLRPSSYENSEFKTCLV